MIFGIATFLIYIYLMSNLDNLSLKEGKNYLIILPLIFIFSLIELFTEVKYGLTKTGKLTFKSFKNIYYYFNFKRLNRKIKKNKQLKPKQIIWLKKYKKRKEFKECL